MKYITVLLVISLLFVFAKIPGRGNHIQTLRQVCDLVSEKFYRDDEALAVWIEDCRKGVNQISLFTSRDEFMGQIRGLLANIEVSHLMIYDPKEDRRLWRGQDLDTGLRFFHIEDRFFLKEIIAGSPLAKMNLEKGDELISIDGKSPLSKWQAESTSGTFRFKHKESLIDLPVETSELQIDRAPTFIDNVLAISSFRAEYFYEPAWLQLSSEVEKAKGLIVDLRGNSGGNFVAMLRALSIFFCDEVNVGLLSQPRRPKDRSAPPPDDLDEMKQIEWLQDFKEVPLSTFTKYGCYQGQVVVLVDGQSSSVTEIFAEAMSRRPNTQVWGQSTAGDVVLATWYGLRLLGPGYSISIPEATYLTEKGELLEGTGVFPSRELQYVISDAEQGRDSWILRAKEYLSIAYKH